MHVVMYSIQSSFCTECPLPSSSDTDLICTGDFVQPLASLLCLGGVELPGPEWVWKTQSRLCWQSIRMRDTHRYVETVPGWAASLIYDALHVEMCTCRTASPGAHWWNREVTLHSCSASEFWLCRDDVPHAHKKMLNQRSAAAHWTPNNGSEASWKSLLDWDYCLSDVCPFHLQQGHCGPPADEHSVFIWMSIDLGAMLREGSLENLCARNVEWSPQSGSNKGGKPLMNLLCKKKENEHSGHVLQEKAFHNGLFLKPISNILICVSS